MYVENLQQLLQKAWKEAKKRFFYPETPQPELVSFSLPWPAMSMKQKKILANKTFIDRYSHKIGTVYLIDAILNHGLAHYSVCPWDTRTHISLFHEALKVTGNTTYARFVTDIFVDIVVDYHCFQHGWLSIETILEKIAPDESPHLNILLPLYKHVWGINTGPGKDVLDKSIIEYLAEIDYLDRKTWTRNIKKVARALKSDLPVIIAKGKNSSPLMGHHDISSYSAPEFFDFFRSFARDFEDPEAFNKLFSSVNEAYGKLTNGEPRGKMGRSLGHEVKVSPFFYMSLAEKYRMKIRKMDMKKDGALYPFSHVQWSVSDPFYDIDIWNSLGKVLPPLTVKWKKKEGEIYSSHDKAPDCMILVDSSGSMPNPSKTLSYAVLGACCAADAYLREDASVSVYNFSDAPAGNRKLLVDSRNKAEIYDAICTYFGGGTAIEIDVIKDIISWKQLDIFLITDMEITNLEQLIKLFASFDNIRVTAVHIGEKKGVERFQKAAKAMRNVSIYGIEKPKDIMNIVLGQLEEYIWR